MNFDIEKELDAVRVITGPEAGAATTASETAEVHVRHTEISQTAERIEISVDETTITESVETTKISVETADFTPTPLPEETGETATAEDNPAEASVEDPSEDTADALSADPDPADPAAAIPDEATSVDTDTEITAEDTPADAAADIPAEDTPEDAAAEIPHEESSAVSEAEAPGKDTAAEISAEETSSVEKESGTAPAPHQGMVRVVGVRFRTAGKIYYFAPGDFVLARGSHVIVETARGMEYGFVVGPPMEVPKKKIQQPLRSVLRISTEEDDRRVAKNRENEREAFRICRERIRRRGLDMKLIDAEYTFDNSKLLFYFTADGRVDFRELVKDLAGVFRTRIELRQVGVRDETKILGGYGGCGRPLCCHTWLSDFVPVSIKMAKEQNLSLNPGKISGVCGRLMCCLKNEADTYEELNKTIPHPGDEVEADDGMNGLVESVNILRQTARIIVEVDDEKELHEYNVSDLTILRRRKRGTSRPSLRREQALKNAAKETSAERRPSRGARAASNDRRSDRPNAQSANPAEPSEEGGRRREGRGGRPPRSAEKNYDRGSGQGQQDHGTEQGPEHSSDRRNDRSFGQNQDRGGERNYERSNNERSSRRNQETGHDHSAERNPEKNADRNTERTAERNAERSSGRHDRRASRNASSDRNTSTGHHPYGEGGRDSGRKESGRNRRDRRNDRRKNRPGQTSGQGEEHASSTHETASANEE